MADSVLFVGTVGEGIWRSSDGGDNWCRSCKGMFVECDVRALVADPRTTSIYAGTNEGVWRSTDRGENWTRLEGPMNDMVTWSLLVDARHDRLFAGTRPAGIFRSTDGGTSWRRCMADPAQEGPGIRFNRVTTLSVDPLDRDRLWAGVEIDGVWTSHDRGETWHKVGRGLSSADIHGLTIVPRPDGRRTLLATTNNDLNISRDDGETWEPQRVENRFDHAYCRGLVQRPDRPEVLFLGNGDAPPGTVGSAWRTPDAGQTWQRLVLPCTPNSTIWDFAINRSRPDEMYAYSVSGEVYHSPDGGDRWTKLPREFGEIRAMLCVKPI